MAQVMNPEVFKSAARTDAAPRSLQIGEARAWQLAGDDPGIVVRVGKAPQDGAGLGSEWYDPPASLAFAQA